MQQPHALYRFYDKADELLYVGLTCNPPGRLATHRRDKPWWTTITRIELETFPSRSSCMSAEKLAIKNEHPRFNVIDRGATDEQEGSLRQTAEEFAAARTERDEAIREAAGAGMTRRAIAAIVGISHQRVQQIIRAE